MSYWITPATKNRKDIRNISTDKVIEDVCRTYGVTLEEIRTQKRKREYVIPKQAICYILYIVIGLKQRVVAEKVNTSTCNVIPSYRSMQDAIDTEYETRKTIEAILERNDVFRYYNKQYGRYQN